MFRIVALVSAISFFDLSACSVEQNRNQAENGQHRGGSAQESQGPSNTEEQDAVDRQLVKAMERASARLGPIIRAEERERLVRMEKTLQKKGYSTSIEGLVRLALQKEALLSDRDNAMTLLLEVDDPRRAAVVREISEDKDDFLRMLAVRYRLWLFREEATEADAVAGLMEQAGTLEEKFDFAVELAYSRRSDGVQYLLEVFRGEDQRSRVRAIRALSDLASRSLLEPSIDFLSMCEEELKKPSPQTRREIEAILRAKGLFLGDKDRVKKLLARAESMEDSMNEN